MIDYREDARWTVYIHIVPKEISGYDHDKYYVGITSRKPEIRWGKNGARYDERHPYFFNAIKKYGWENMQHEIIANHLTKSEACDMEKTLIKNLKSNNKNYGYNITSGGEGVCGIIPWSKGKHLSDETKQKLSNKLKGRYIDNEWRENISKAVKKRWEENGDLKIRMTGKNNPNYGKPSHFKNKKGFDNPTSKSVICLNNLEIYGSASVAAEINNVSFSEICACCRCEKHTAGIDKNGIPLIWMWHNTYILMSKHEIFTLIIDKLQKTKYKPVINLETKELFANVKSTVIKYSNSKNTSYFVKNIKSNKKTYGYSWKYYFDYLKENNLTIYEAQSSLFFIV